MKDSIQYPRTILQFSLVLLCSLIISAPIVFLESYIQKEYYAALFMMTFTTVFTSIVYLLNRKHGVKLSTVHLFSVSRKLPIMILIVILFQLTVNVPLGISISNLFGLKSTTTNPFDSVIGVFNIVLLAPIVEEWIFRGVCLRGFLSRYSPCKAIIVSSIIFAIIHFQPIQLLGALCLGLFLGYIYFVTKSLTNTIILHLVANIAGLLVRYLNYKIGIYSQCNLWFCLCLILIGIVLCTLLIKPLYKSKSL